MNLSDESYFKRKENPRTVSGKFLWFIEKSAHNCKCFILRNKTCMDISFILIYLIEQAIFLYLIFKKGYAIQILSSIFILILLTTMAIERSLMELRYTSLNKEISTLTNQNVEFRNMITRTKKVIESTMINLKKLK